jgi:molybdopterin synthase sulfur carrier subunit
VSITVLYFAAVRDLVGKDEESLDLPEAVASIEALATHLTSLHPELAGRLGSVRFARNEEFAQSADPVADGDTIALIPPVAGG